MNLLAHAYLSFNDAPVLLGNMISDHVKGKKQFEYSAGIQKGIQLHRAIDAFTDAHQATKELKEFFRPQYRLYAGAFADIVYDHFLANDKNIFEDEKALRSFTQTTYILLEKNEQWFGERFGAMFPYMRSNDWLYNYRFDEGIQKSFEGMRRRSAYIEETGIAFEIFIHYKKDMQQYYDTFFPAVNKFAADTLAQLLNS